MSSDDYDFDDDDFDDPIPGMSLDGDASGTEEGEGASEPGWRQWLTARRGWVLLIGLSLAQALFAIILLYLRSEARTRAELEQVSLQELAVEMLGHEVRIDQIFQLIPMRGGKSMTVGLDLVIVLGQLPEERIEGSLRPTPREMDSFIGAIEAMEPDIRSRVNMMLQQMRPQDLGGVEAQNTIKREIRQHINDRLERLDFGSRMRPEIGRRRVTDVLIPMFVRQNL